MVDKTEMHLWVVEAIIDIPIYPVVPSFIIPTSIGDEDPDGSIQMRPIDLKRAKSSVLWSAPSPSPIRSGPPAWPVASGPQLQHGLNSPPPEAFGPPGRLLARS
jgi:hypothetical protein